MNPMNGSRCAFPAVMLPKLTTLGYLRFRCESEDLYGKARRVWLMDRGIPTEAVLAEMRAAEQEMFYLVGTPRGRVTKYEKQ